MGKLKGLLEVAAVALLALTPVIATVGGAMLGASLLGGAGLAAAAVGVAGGAYLGFIAGYVAVGQSPIKMMGSAPSSLKDDVRRASTFPVRMAKSMYGRITRSFNKAAGPNTPGQVPTPANNPKPVTPPQP